MNEQPQEKVKGAGPACSSVSDRVLALHECMVSFGAQHCQNKQTSERSINHSLSMSLSARD